MAYDKPAVIIDNGSYLIKAGFACDNHPVSIFRTVVARPSYLNGGYGRALHYEVYIGDDAVARIDDYDLDAPVVNGRIVQWDNMERIWHHIFYRELKAAPEDRSVVMACSSNTSMEEKIKCCQVFFETLNIPAFCMQPQPAMALYASGFTTGVAIDLGFDTTDISPVYEGGVIDYAQMCTGYAGAQIRDFIRGSLIQRDIDFGVRTPEIINKIIKKCLYVTPNAAMSRKNYQRPFRVPLGDVIDVFDEAFMACEMFFQPDLVMGEKTNILPIQNAFATSCLKCDSDLRTELYSAVVICGGLSMIPGLSERMKLEIEELVRKPINLVTSAESDVVSWMGAATFAGITESHKLWVSKKQYEDQGARIVKNRFM